MPWQMAGSEDVKGWLTRQTVSSLCIAEWDRNGRKLTTSLRLYALRSPLHRSLHEKFLALRATKASYEQQGVDVSQGPPTKSQKFGRYPHNVPFEAPSSRRWHRGEVTNVLLKQSVHRLVSLDMDGLAKKSFDYKDLPVMIPLPTYSSKTSMSVTLNTLTSDHAIAYYSIENHVRSRQRGWNYDLDGD